MKKEIKDKIDVGIDFVIGNGGELIGALLEDTIVSVGIPIVSNTIILYKQKRFERNITKMLKLINDRVSEFEEILNMISKDNLDNFKNFTLPNVMDFIIDENQIEKIKYYINLMVNIVRSEKSDIGIDEESFEISLLSILAQMTLNDISDFLEIGDTFYNPSGYVESKAIQLTETPDRELINKKLTQEKLKNLGLIYMPLVLGEMSGSGQFLHSSVDCKLTYFGEIAYKYINK